MKLLLPAIAVAMVVTISDDHRKYPPHSWISKHTNGFGMNCCDPRDVKIIPYDLALRLHVGDKYVGMFPSGSRNVQISAIHPSQDRFAYITAYGCVFIPEFM